MVIVTKSEQRKIRSIEKIIQQAFVSKNIPTGIEICEIQLYHLANKIKDTKINKDVDSYLPAINEVLEGIDRDELIKKIVSVEFTRFSNYYNKKQDLNVSSDNRASGSGAKDGSVRYFINVGEKDGYDWMSLKDFLRDTLNLGKDDIYKVDTKDTFSFFNTDEQHSEAILRFFTDFKLEGRFINVEVSKNPGGDGGGRGRKGRNKRRGKERDRGNRGSRRERGNSKSGSNFSGKRRSKKNRSDFF